MFNQLRKLNKNEILELQELHRIAAAERFKEIQIKNNTALIPDGKRLAHQTKAVADLMEKTKGAWISQKLAQLGYGQNVKVNINIATGKIIIVK